MRSNIGAFLLALVVAAVLTPVIRRMALALGAVTSPGGRHVHHVTIPRLGGIAIAIAFSCPIVALFFLDAGVAVALRGRSDWAVGTLCGAGALSVLGVWDDTRGVGALTKLWIQIAAACFAYWLGFRIEAVSLPFIGH